jgi:hypothetical protein
VLRPGAAQCDVGVPPRQVGEVETGYDFQRNAGQSRRKSGSRGAMR